MRSSARGSSSKKNSAVRLSFSEGQVILEAGQGDNAQTSEALEATLHGEDIVMAFNPSFLQEGARATSAPYVRLSFTSASKPAVLTAQPEIDGEDDQESAFCSCRSAPTADDAQGGRATERACILAISR